jgi:formiminotetrahydrofolate cyclodeaminase
MYRDGSLAAYLDDLAARKPAPGGGSAAALEAATGCALISMVLNFTISNKKYQDVKNKAVAALKVSEGLRDELTILVDEDVAAYGKLSDGFKSIPKDSPDLDKLYKDACDVPLKICRSVRKALDLLREVVEYGNRNLVTDSAIAALMLNSAFFGAKFNVYINLKYMKDNDNIARIHKELSAAEEKIPALKEEILHISEDIILK